MEQGKLMGMRLRYSAVGVSMLASVGLTSASGLSGLGAYTTQVPEDRLFIKNGRVLRCDLFFSVPGKDTVVAPKGSELDQSVPPVVWQYSGLLPVSDYIKTAAIHSVSSADKTRDWRDVQHTFYDGLRAEGASMADAKIAFAGAYAFAPRWPLVEFIQVDEDQPKFPDTILYRVEYNEPTMKGMSLENYRQLSLEILDQAEDVTLADIQAVIDSADGTKEKEMERASLGGIGGVDISGGKLMSKADKMVDTVGGKVSVDKLADGELGDASEGVVVSMPEDSVSVANSGAVGGVSVGSNGSLLHSKDLIVNKAGDDKLTRTAEKTAESETPDAIDIAAAAATATDVEVEVEVEVEDSEVLDKMVDTESTELESTAVPAEVVETVEVITGETIEITDDVMSELRYGETPVAKVMSANELFFDDTAAFVSGDKDDVMMAKDGIDETSEAMAIKVRAAELTAESLADEETLLPSDKLQAAEIVKMPFKDLFYDDSGMARDGENSQTVSAEALATLDGPEDEWVVLPDGTLVLRSINKLVSE